jgi:hypothetical protein
MCDSEKYLHCVPSIVAEGIPRSFVEQRCGRFAAELQQLSEREARRGAAGRREEIRFPIDGEFRESTEEHEAAMAARFLSSSSSSSSSFFQYFAVSKC